MGRESVDRVKRRLLAEAVAENLDTMRGGPPRALRPANRILKMWLRRAPLLLVPITLAASTYFNGGPAAQPHDTIASAAVLPADPRPRPNARPTVDSLAPLDTHAFSLAVKRVVIDAGHGGADPGTSIVRLAEKDITLDVATRLKAMLEKNGFQVVITRGGDKLIPLRDRARLANESSSDIFVSIHVNSIVAHTASHGVETYYLGPTSDPSLTRLAADENRLSGYSLADLRKLLDGVYADARRSESQRLAAAVQQQLFTKLRKSDPGLENWGVKRAPFIVLVATEMPAILAEVGCLSNEKEASMLGRAEYRQQIAEALFHGIRSYANQG
ncbi:MAG TPA: N-acetylmuramoyl-L-alanine amidase [Thermoanaerobaculia bacterium]|jgi:N-acetylmuramoyl-L-alanine amidase|nr:N-acetylmuramoyl-L-alanine amidase [Thermoanaerobaculia bacterium]